jgi:hypothetical protein
MFHVVIDVVVAYQQTMLVYLFHFITWAQILPSLLGIINPLVI